MTQLDLLSGTTPLDFAAATAARDRAIAQHDPDGRFAADASIALWRTCLERETFIVDDVWQHMPPEVAITCDKRAMGSVMSVGRRKGWIEPTTMFRPSAQPQCHANPRRVWLSRIFRRSY